LRIIYAGTPAFAAAALTALLDGGHDVVQVLTQPDRPAGRGLKPQASAVKQLALARQLPLSQPATLKDAALTAQLADLQAEDDSRSPAAVAVSRLSEYPCVDAAAVARCSTDPARHTGRRS